MVDPIYVVNMPWNMVLLGGGLGGLMNAALSSNLRLMPSLAAALLPGDTRRLLRVGLLANLVASGGTVAGLAWTLSRLLDVRLSSLPSEQILLGGVLVGFLVARGLTSEVDKGVLRLAVRTAASAPAAHPEVAKAIEHAPPYAVYQITTTLVPRRRALPGSLHST